MKSRANLILLLFLLWGAGSTYWYVCRIKGFCAADQTAQTEKMPESKPAANKAPRVQLPFLYFKKGDPTAYVADDSLWKIRVHEALSGLSGGQRLEINAPYYSAEAAPAGFANMGLARAARIKDLLAAFTDTSRVLTAARLLPGQDSIPAVIPAFPGLFAAKTYNDYVQQSGDTVRIYFPFNSHREIRNPQINAYLDRLADNLKAHPGWKARITGHTDNIGKALTNYYIGLQRAHRVQKMLVARGVNPGQTEVLSGGEKHPVASNKTPQGRARNRRVEIIIIR